LTEELIKKRPKKLTLIELDSSMVDILNMRIKNQDFNLN
jgi:16S rRNA A1518/A1519 N6-dimethyltransferase RsmA/KsgA/DIM1 with predicted DNA glycosylase/AP lyase activity